MNVAQATATALTHTQMQSLPSSSHTQSPSPSTRSLVGVAQHATILTGRWMHIGIQHREPGMNPGCYSQKSWDALCTQAARWGMTGVTPKVGEGTRPWYSISELTMLKEVALGHGLQIVPMHYVGGDHWSAYESEAYVVAHIASLFGALILDMEQEWIGQPTANMANYGPSIRKHGYQGPLYPTTYANALQHATFPYLQMMSWATAWLPQVYFDEWTLSGTRMSALDAVNFLLPQWDALDAACLQAGQGGIRPIMPLIGVAGTPQLGQPDSHEIGNWLTMMGGYGYCGFWHYDVYSSYAAVVQSAPIPKLMSTPAPILSAPTPIAHPPVVVPSLPAPATPSSALPIFLPIPKPVVLQPIPPVPAALIGEPTQIEIPVVTPVSSSTSTPVPEPEPEPNPEPPVPIVTAPISVSSHTVEGAFTYTDAVVALGSLIPEVEQMVAAAGSGTSTSDPSGPVALEDMGLSSTWTDEQFKLIWHWEGDSTPYDPASPIYLCWKELIRQSSMGSADWIGYPLHDMATKISLGETMNFMTFSSGRTIVEFADHTVHII